MAETPRSAGQKVAADVSSLLRARNPLIWLVTREEARVEGFVAEAAAAAKYLTLAWDVAAGVTSLDGKKDSRFTDPDPNSTLNTIRALAEKTGTDRGVWIMRDLPVWLNGPGAATTLRNLRNLVRWLPGVPRERAQAIVILSPNGDVPPELTNHATVIDWPLPDRIEIAGILDAALDALPDGVKENAAPNGTREAAIDAAVGLSGEEAAACYARSLVTTRKIDPVLIANEKRRVIAREKVLEWYDPIPGGLDAVGGLENVKSWLLARKSAYSPKAREYGLPLPRGIFVFGVSGCLAEGTRVAYLRGNRVSSGGRELPIEKLYLKFNGMTAPGRGRPWSGFPTYAQSWDAETGYLMYNEIRAVKESGAKECIRITTDISGSIDLTMDHPLLDAEGLFQESGKFKIGDRLLVRGSMKPISRNAKRIYRKRTVIEGLKYHPVAWSKFVTEGRKTYEYGRITQARLVVEAEMNKTALAEFIEVLKSDPKRAATFQFLPAEYDVHHADDDPLNDTLANLVVMTHSNHARLHGNVRNFNREHTIVATVIRIENLGVRRTFDVTMAEPFTNFAVNDGFIVHNCGKTLLAKATATNFEVPLIRFDLNALKGKFVGESEGNLRKALRIIEAIGRCVVWLDEIEKTMQGATSGASDGGVSADALGTVLTWMQERQGGAFVIATANDVEALPPELMRKGRFDEMFFVDLPTEPERRSVIKAALRANGRGHVKIDDAAVALKTEGFTGAEIAALVPDALYAAFADKGREITTGDVIAAAESVVPLSKTAAEKIGKLRAWGAGRSRPATRQVQAETAKTVRSLDL